MFERLLVKKYIFQQKRHSILTICSIMTALALMTALFTGFSTVFQCLRDVSFDNQPWHYKVVDLTKDKAELLLDLPEFNSNIVIEQDYTCSVELLLKDYTEYNYFKDIDDYWKNLDITLNQINVNRSLINYDLIDLDARGNFVQIFAVFYVFVIVLALLLRLVIDTAFEISSKERERQFGVLQSIGATPQQIVKLITYEGLMLSCIGIPSGILTGIGIGYGAFRAVLTSGIAEAFLTDGQENLLHYHLHPVLILIAGITGFVWVMLSAYGTGMRVIKMTPIQAISNRSNKIKKVRKRTLLGLLFGWKGKLASRNNRRQFKRFIITVLSLTLSMILYASVSFVMDRFSEFEQTYFDTIYGQKNYDLLLFTDSEADDYLNTVQKMEDSGYFTSISYGISKFGRSDDRVVLINYVNKDMYLKEFGNNPPVSYEELTVSGSYLYSGHSEFEEDVFTLQILYDHNQGDLEKRDENFEFPIAFHSGLSAVIEKEMFDEDKDHYIYLYAPIELYLNSAKDLYHSAYGSEIEMMLSDTKQHDQALAFLNSLDITENDIFDNYQIHQQIDTTASAIGIGMLCINIMIALIAVVNMVNILSTGILNRKSELASLQSIGMTNGQLYGMTIIECSQYALTAGVIASIVCELMLLATDEMLWKMNESEAFQSLFDYAEPLGKIWFAVLIAFVIAVISSIIPLNAMQRTPLTEQIRSID